MNSNWNPNKLLVHRNTRNQFKCWTFLCMLQNLWVIFIILISALWILESVLHRVCVCMCASVYACLCFCVKSSICYLHYSCTTSWTITTYNLLPTCNILGVQWPTSLLPLIYINFLSIEVFFLNTLDFLWILLRSIWKIDNSINWHANMNGGNSTRSYPQIKKNR